MKFLVRLLVQTVSIFVGAYVIPGVAVDSIGTAAIVAIILGTLNAFVKPMLMLLTLPINIITLGLFSFVINTFLVLVTAKIVPGFGVDSILMAFIFSIVISFINSFLSSLVD